MALHPGIEPIVTSVAASTSHPATATVAERRAQYRELAQRLWPHPTPVAAVRETHLPVNDGLPARLYVPDGDEGTGLLLFFHGGSFVLGDLDSHDGICRRLAADTRMRLLSVAYRLAPEFPFPAPVEDAVAALRYVGTHLAAFTAPTARVIVIGDSAGATLAAAAAASTRGEALPVAAQALLYPTLGPDLLTSSAHDYATGYLLDVEHLRHDYDLYLTNPTDHGDARASLLLNLDLAGSPPAVVVVAEFDPLRDEAVAYAGLLEHFGTPVELLEAEGMIHGFLRLGGVLPDALAIVDDLAEHLHHFVESSR